MESLTLLIVGSILVFVVTIINPFYVIPVFMVGHFIEPMKYFPELKPYYPAIVVGAVVLSGWLAHSIIYRDFVRADSKQVVFTWLLILAVLVSASIGEQASWPVTILHLRTFIPYFIFLYMIRTRVEVIQTIWLLIFFGVIVSLYGLYCLKAGIGVSEHGIKRIRSFFENPNAFGETLTLIVPFAIALLYAKYRGIIKLIVLTTIPLFIAGVVISYSRKCFFVLIPSVLFITQKFYAGEKKLFALAGAVMILVFAAYVFPSPAKYRMWKRVRTVFQAESAESLDSGRTETAKAGWLMLKENPLLGVGIGAFQKEYANLAQGSIDVVLIRSTKREGYAMGAHNVIVEVGAQLGLLGLLLYMAIVITAYRDSRYAEKLFLESGDDTLRSIAAALQVFIISVMMIGMFTGTLDSKIFWIMIPLSATLKRLSLEAMDHKYEEVDRPDRALET